MCLKCTYLERLTWRPALLPSAREWSALREELSNDTLAVVIAGLGEKLGRDVEFVRVAGRGAFADVAIAKSVESGVEIAVKISAGSGNMTLLQRESNALGYLNSLEDAGTHVVQMHLPYLEVDVPFQDGSVVPMGLFVLESGLCDVDEFVRENAEKDPSAVASVLDRWEESTKWLHSHSVLHLDIKAENAVVCEDGCVKLIDTTGIITRFHSMDEDDDIPADKVSWDTALLAAQDIPYISTGTYAQPDEAGPGGRVLDYSADWWSMGVSKIEMLSVKPSMFEEGADTAAMVMESLESGELEIATRQRLAVLLGVEPGSEQVSAWVRSVMANLRGSASEGPLTQQ
jgi:serine/threonine protein kinase